MQIEIFYYCKVTNSPHNMDIWNVFAHGLFKISSMEFRSRTTKEKKKSKELMNPPKTINCWEEANWGAQICKPDNIMKNNNPETTAEEEVDGATIVISKYET